jgi:hypothetical protein
MAQKPNGANKTKPKSKAKKNTKSEQLLLKQIGLQIHKALYEKEKPVEWLSFKSGIARSSIREIIAGRSNARILTLNTLAKHLGFEDVCDMVLKRTDQD